MYSDSFKEHVVKSIVFEGLGVRQASGVFNISSTSIETWVKEFKKN